MTIVINVTEKVLQRKFINVKHPQLGTQTVLITKRTTLSFPWY